MKTSRSILTHLIWALCLICVVWLVFSAPSRRYFRRSHWTPPVASAPVERADRSVVPANDLSDSDLEAKVKNLVLKGLDKANLLVDQIEPEDGTVLTLDEQFGALERSVRQVKEESVNGSADSTRKDELSDAWDEALESLREARQQVALAVSLSAESLLSGRRENGALVAGKESSMSKRSDRYSRRQDVARLWKGMNCQLDDSTWAKNGSIVIDDVDYLTAPAAERPALRARFFDRLNRYMDEKKAELDEDLTGPAVIGKPIASMAMSWARHKMESLFDKTDALLEGK